MQNKQDKMAQILLYVVLGLLTVFLVFGIYALVSRYIFQSPNNLILAGWLSIGVCLIGFGLVMILQSSMMDAPNGSFFATFRLNATMPSAGSKKLDAVIAVAKTKFQAKVSGGDFVTEQTTVYVCEDGLCINGFPESDTEFLFADMTGYSREKNEMTLYGSFAYGEEQVLESIVLYVDMPLSLRVVETELTKRQIKKQ